MTKSTNKQILENAKLLKEIDTKEKRLNMYPYLSNLAQNMPSSKVHLIDNEGNSVDEYRFFITVPEKFNKFSDVMFENIKNGIDSDIKNFFVGIENCFGKVVMRDRIANIERIEPSIDDSFTIDAHMSQPEEISPQAYNKILDLAIELGEEMSAVESILNGEYQSIYDDSFVITDDMISLCKNHIKEVAERIYYEIQDIVKHQLELPNRDNYTISESFHNGDDVLNDDFYINHTNEHDRYSDSKNINNDFEI